MLTTHSPNHYWLINARIPSCFIEQSLLDAWGISLTNLWHNATLQRDRLIPCHLEVTADRITHILPNIGDSLPSQISPESVTIIDAKQGMLTPCFVDLHTHLDKGHIWERNPNLDGTFQGALTGVYKDCTEERNWSYEDLYRRMEFGLKCSYAHGTKAIRTHLDCPPHQIETTFRVFQDLRDRWKDKITLQAVSLVPLAAFSEAGGEKFADQIAEIDGVIGGIAHSSADLDGYLKRIFDLASDRHLSLDFHADENNQPESQSLRQIALSALEYGFAAQIVCGHCCSLAVQEPEIAASTIALVHQAKIGIVSLPMCNMYLQDRQAERTPRWRGVTLVRELDAAGVTVALSSDNCRDPFYGFGDHDLLQVFSMGTKIAHLDTPYDDWIASVTTRPATLMGIADTCQININAPADFVLFKARCYSELLSRPQSDRQVFRNGVSIDRTLPDYAELD
ncbi:MAG: cytosine deaminase [Pseudanabaenaceae cyanobacterium bins.39]|nr:cytosine deaminase [Pseudanabaenaceae cyanobacterium bins.39]